MQLRVVQTLTLTVKVILVFMYTGLSLLCSKIFQLLQANYKKLLVPTIP